MTDYIDKIINTLEQDKLDIFDAGKEGYIPDVIKNYRLTDKNIISSNIIDLINRFNYTGDTINLLLYESLENYQDNIKNSVKYRVLSNYNLYDIDESDIISIKNKLLRRQQKKLKRIKLLKNNIKNIKLHPKNENINSLIDVKKFYNIKYFDKYLTKDNLKSFFHYISLTDNIVFIQLKYDNQLYTKCNDFKNFFEKPINNETILIYVKIGRNEYAEINIKKYIDYSFVFDYDDYDYILSLFKDSVISFFENTNIYRDSISGRFEIFLPNFTEYKFYRSLLFDETINKFLFLDESDFSRSILKLSNDAMQEGCKYQFDETGSKKFTDKYFKIDKIVSSYYNVSFYNLCYQSVPFFINIVKYFLTKCTDDNILQISDEDSNMKVNISTFVNNIFSNSIFDDITNDSIKYVSNVLSRDTKIVIPPNKVTKDNGYILYNNQLQYINCIQEKKDRLILSKIDKNLEVKYDNYTHNSISKISNDDEEEIDEDDEEEVDDDIEDVEIKFLDYNYSGTFFSKKKLRFLNKCNTNFKLKYARTCFPKKQPIIIDNDDFEDWKKSGYSIKKYNNNYFACPDKNNFPVIYTLDIELPCCGKYETKPKFNNHMIYEAVKNFTVNSSKTFLLCVHSLLPKQLRKYKTEDKIINHMIKLYKLEIISQECYHLNNDEKVNKMLSCFDSQYFYKLIEHILGVNVFIIKRTGFEIPNSANYHCREINTSLKSIIIYKNENSYSLFTNNETKDAYFDSDVTVEINKIYSKFGYMININNKIYKNPTNYYNWNKILKNHQIISQKINSSGRMYCVDILFVDSSETEHVISLFVQETYPMYTDEDNKIYKTTIDVCKELLGEPALISQSGCFYNVGDIERSLFVPCITTSEDNDYKCVNYEILSMSNEDYDINNLGNIYNFSLLLIKLVLFAKSIEENMDINLWTKKYVKLFNDEDINYKIVNHDLGIRFKNSYEYGNTEEFITFIQNKIKEQALPKEYKSIFKNNKIYLSQSIYRRFRYNLLYPLFKKDNLILKNLNPTDMNLNFNKSNVNLNHQEVELNMGNNDNKNFLITFDNQIYKCEFIGENLYNAVNHVLNYNNINTIISKLKGTDAGINSYYTRVSVKNIELYYIELLNESDTLFFNVDQEVYINNQNIGEIKSISKNRLYVKESINFKPKSGFVYHKTTENFDNYVDKLLNIVVIIYDSSLKPYKITSMYQTNNSVDKFVDNSNNVYVKTIYYNNNYYSLISL